MTLTVNDVYMELRRRFKAADIPMPDLEARELAAFVSHADKRRTADWAYRYLDDATVEAARALAERRLNGEPLAYLIGEWDFYGYTFHITPDVLIPRTDTEKLCELAVLRAKEVVNPRVLDLCCGSGCIGLALLKEVSDARVAAVDISGKALSVARENANLLGVQARYVPLMGDAMGEPDPHLGRFHILVCNPPYITAAEMRELDHSVADFEPALALYGGEDGLDFYRSIARRWAGLVLPGGRMYFECGWRQATQVAGVFEDCGFRQISIEEDLSGVPRIVVIEKPA